MKTDINLSTVSVISAVVMTDCHKLWPVAIKNEVIKLDPEPVTPPNKYTVTGLAVSWVTNQISTLVIRAPLNVLNQPRLAHRPATIPIATLTMA